MYTDYGQSLQQADQATHEELVVYVCQDRVLAYPSSTSHAAVIGHLLHCGYCVAVPKISDAVEHCRKRTE
jgi:hypothetical protein